jgi:hypothetical protein
MPYANRGSLGKGKPTKQTKNKEKKETSKEAK